MASLVKADYFFLDVIGKLFAPGHAALPQVDLDSSDLSVDKKNKLRLKAGKSVATNVSNIKPFLLIALPENLQNYPKIERVPRLLNTSIFDFAKVF